MRPAFDHRGYHPEQGPSERAHLQSLPAVRVQESSSPMASEIHCDVKTGSQHRNVKHPLLRPTYDAILLAIKDLAKQCEFSAL